MQRILVTGGAGFIGSHTVDLLLANGYHVVVIDNLMTGKTSHLNLSHPNLRFVMGDILDYPLLLAEMRQCRAVLHLAALASVPKSIEDPIQSFKLNMQGFLHVLQAIRELNGSTRLVYASSAAVYGSSGQLPSCDETALSSTVNSPYALEKANNERYAELFAKMFGVRSLGLRYFNVYGPRQDPHSPYSGVIAKFIHQVKEEEMITIYGDGKQSRDFIYVADVARANLLALDNHYCGVLNIATGVSETLLNLILYIEKITGKQANTCFAGARIGDIIQSYAKVALAEQKLGFSYATSLEQGMRALLAENAVS